MTHEYFVWHKKFKEMKPVIVINWRDKTVETKHEIWKMKNCILLQYSGAEDELGNRMYDGSIWEFRGKYYIINRERTGFVPYFYDYANKKWKPEDIIFNDRGEVVGNIYENEEIVNEIEGV